MKSTAMSAIAFTQKNVDASSKESRGSRSSTMNR
jgi:hypothetical protein